jgi:hypothetical protein
MLRAVVLLATAHAPASVRRGKGRKPRKGGASVGDRVSLPLTGAYRACEDEVARMLVDLLHKQQDYAAKDPERLLDAAQNAQLIGMSGLSNGQDMR